MSNSIQIVALLLALSAAMASAFQYQVTVQTGYSFEVTPGSINLTVASDDYRSKEIRLVEDQFISPGSKFSKYLDLPFTVDYVRSANVSYTLMKHSMSHTYKITVAKVLVEPTYYVNDDVRKEKTVSLTAILPEMDIADKRSYEFVVDGHIL